MSRPAQMISSSSNSGSSSSCRSSVSTRAPPSTSRAPGDVEQRVALVDDRHVGAPDDDPGVRALTSASVSPNGSDTMPEQRALLDVVAGRVKRAEQPAHRRALPARRRRRQPGAPWPSDPARRNHALGVQHPQNARHAGAHRHLVEPQALARLVEQQSTPALLGRLAQRAVAQLRVRITGAPNTSAICIASSLPRRHPDLRQVGAVDRRRVQIDPAYPTRATISVMNRCASRAASDPCGEPGNDGSDRAGRADSASG